MRYLFSLLLSTVALAQTSFIISPGYNNEKNDCTGYVGFKFTVAGTDINVTQLGARLNTSTGVHTVEIVKDSDKSVVATTDFTPSSSTISYGAALGSPVTLTSGVTYYVVISTTNGGDHFWDVMNVTHTADATISDGVYNCNGSGWQTYGGANTAFGVPSFLYTVAGVPSTCVLTSPNAPTITGPAITLAATATPLMGHMVTSVRFQVDGVTVAGDTTSPYSILWDSTTIANGVHIFTAVATDDVLNTTTSDPVTITITNSAITSTIPITLVGATEQQVVVSFRASNPAIGHCKIAIYQDSGFTRKVHDTDIGIFTDGEDCSRPYNVVDGKLVTAVLGRRTSELANAGIQTGRKVERSLQTDHSYYIKVSDYDANTFGTLQVSTATIPWGRTNIEDAPISSIAGEFAYPNLDWTPAGDSTSYTDPVSGVEVHRTAIPQWNPAINSPDSFIKVFDESSSWTSPNNILSTSGSYASTNNQGVLFLPFTDSDISRGGPDQYIWWGGHFINDIEARFDGYCPSGSSEACTVQACLGSNHTPGWNCSSLPLDINLGASSSTFAKPASFPNFPLIGWGFVRTPVLEDISVPWGECITVTSSVATMTNCGDRSFFPVKGVHNNKINIGGTYYTVDQVTSATTLTLQESSVNISSTYWIWGGFGVLVRKKTADTNTIYLSKAQYRTAFGVLGGPPANGVPRYCSDLTFSVSWAADGTTPLNPPLTGRMCQINGDNFYYGVLLSDGSFRWLSNLDHLDYSGTGTGFRIPAFPFSPTNPYALVGIHTDDSYGYIADSHDPRAGLAYRVPYEITYDPSCHFRSYTGNSYATNNGNADCFTWVNKTPGNGHPGATLSEQLGIAVNSIPGWSITGLDYNNFDAKLVAGNYIDFHIKQNPSGGGNNVIAFHVRFDLRNNLISTAYDTFSGGIPNIRWSCTHSTGYGMSDNVYGEDEIAACVQANGTGYGAGPHMFKDVISVSTDGISFNTNTAVTNTMAGACPVTSLGPAAGTLQCLWIKTSSDHPCDIGGSDIENSTYPCPWGAGANLLNQTFQVGDFIQRMTHNNGDGTTGAIENDGKNEKLRILEKISCGVNCWILDLMRWAVNDNLLSIGVPGSPSLAGSAALFFDHLYTGPGGSTHNNGWNAAMTGSFFDWVPLATLTNAQSEPLLGPSGHTGFGPKPTDPLDLTVVAGGKSRIGRTTGDDQTAYHVHEIFASTWEGITVSCGSDTCEQYPTSNRWTAPTIWERSVYDDIRHINPGQGNGAEAIANQWAQTLTLVSGQTFTYILTGALNGASSDYKAHRLHLSSTRFAYRDISGPGSTIDDSKPYTFCQVYKANQCRSGSSVGTLYVVAPNAYTALGGALTNTKRTYTPNASYLQYNSGWMVQGLYDRNDLTGSLQRRITMGLSWPSMQYQFSSPHNDSTGHFSFVRTSYLDDFRPSHLTVTYPSIAPIDNLNRTRYQHFPTKLPPGGDARLRYGYAENGADGTFHCETYQDDCVTDASIAPFAYVSDDSLTATTCSSGCTIDLPLLSGRVAYWRAERLFGSIWIPGPTQIKAVQ